MIDRLVVQYLVGLLSTGTAELVVELSDTADSSLVVEVAVVVACIS
jgi:hypothetical protein